MADPRIPAPALHAASIGLLLWAVNVPCARAGTPEDSSTPDKVVAGAERDAEAEARELFADARKLAAAGEHEKACPKFEASLRLKSGVGVQYNLADCWEQIGKTASARRMFLRAADGAREAGQVEREEAARARAEALELRIPRLAIAVESPAPGLVVERGGDELEPSSWNVAIPLDPGLYELKATASGRRPWSKKVELPASAQTVWVEIPELTELRRAPAAKPQSDRKVAFTVASREDINPQTQSWFTTGRKVGLVLAGVGAAGVTVGVLASLEYKSQNDAARAICPTSVNCTHAEIIEHDELVQGAKSARYWAFLGYGVGGAALIGAGVAFIAGANPPPGARAGVRAEPWIALDGSAVGGALSGSW
jgi:hypothetical protein